MHDLEKVGFTPDKITEISKNAKVASALAQVVVEANYVKQPALLHHLALISRDASESEKSNRILVSQLLGEQKLKSTAQIDAAYKYAISTNEPTLEQMERESGVGVVVTKEQVAQAVAAYISTNAETITKNRYKSLGSVMSGVKKQPELRWAAPALFKPEIDKQFLAFLGPKDARDDPKLAKKQESAAAAKQLKKLDLDVDKPAKTIFEEGFLAALHKPGENPQVDPELMKKHLSATNGKVVTRFPPEPNGFLHIGHSKAITVDFGYAAFHHGNCYLRFDDTNPEAEDDRFAKSILELVDWLGFSPFKVTWSSDYFEELYMLAEKLISNGFGYVCFCTPQQVKQNRGIQEDGTKGGARRACECRSQQPQESLELFRKMRDGEYLKGTATLRMKMDLENPNPQMWDLVAYRVLDAPHHRTGTKWKIYPTYDFTHCLVDSLENVTHSLCTLEFRLSRESYEWLCDAVGVYKPAQREFGRLNMVGSVMSKRKIMQLVKDGHVRDWDDPRLYTLVSLRRRGIPPGAILSFVSELGITTSTSQTEVARFDNSIRKYLENTVPRLMMVLEPVKVILTNLPADFHLDINLPFKPNDAALGEHTVPFTRELYVDASDVREEPSETYFRLAPGQSVGLLRVPHTIKVTEVLKDANGKINAVHAIYENEGPTKKPKAFIQWVAHSPAHDSPVCISEVREFERLFKSDNPSAHPDGFIADLNPESERVYRNALVETGFRKVRTNSPWVPAAGSDSEKILCGKEKKGAPESVRFQALRVGYYTMDSDSTDDKIVLNRIVSLKEDKSKN